MLLRLLVVEVKVFVFGDALVLVYVPHAQHAARTHH